MDVMTLENVFAKKTLKDHLVTIVKTISMTFPTVKVTTYFLQSIRGR